MTAAAFHSAEVEAQNAFNRQVARAQNTSMFKYNRISGISQDTANAYIANGIIKAAETSMNYGCETPKLSNEAVSKFASSVQNSKTSANQKIQNIKANKQAQYRAYQIEQQRQQRIREAIAETLRKVQKMQDMINGSSISKRTFTVSEHADILRAQYNVPMVYTDEYVIEKYGNSNFVPTVGHTNKIDFSINYNGLKNDAISPTDAIFSNVIIQKITDEAVEDFVNTANAWVKQQYPTLFMDRGLVAATTSGNVIIPEPPSTLANLARTTTKYGVPIVSTSIDFFAQIGSGDDIVDATLKSGVHTIVGMESAKYGAAAGTAIGGPYGMLIGAGIGLVGGVTVNYLFDTIYDSFR